MKKMLSVVACAALATFGCAEGVTDVEGNAAPDFLHRAGGGGGRARTYDVTIENLTTGQPFSPGIAATHTKRVHVFRRGAAASEGIRAIAEDGNPLVAMDELTGADGFHDVVVTGPPPVGCIGCGGPPFPTSITFQIEAASNAKRLSLAVMLICTNDGFVGLDRVKLPDGFKPRTFYAGTYDAGTEANDELFTSMVDPCGGSGPLAVGPDGLNDRTATSDDIARHRGISGVGDLDPSVYGFEKRVAKITVQRMN